MYPQEPEPHTTGALVQPPAVPFVGAWSLIAVVAAVLTSLTTLLPDGPLRSVIALGIIGLLQPLLEWRLLQGYVRALPLLQWWAYSIVGQVLGALLLMLIGVVFIVVGLQLGDSQQTGEALAAASVGPLGVIVTGAVLGAASTAARWMLLRQFFRASPLQFFAGAILGLIASGFVGQVALLLFERGTLAADVAQSIIAAIAAGMLTGAGVLSLFRGHAGPERF
jgi:hypothetical protein